MTEGTWNYSASIGARLSAGLQDGPNGCIVWTKSVTTFGYGRIGRGGRGRGWTTTHRAAWEVANGVIPDGLMVCHKCDNPPCCNVDHLFLGTQADNMRDMWSKGRQGGQIQGGSEHPDARLTDAQVSELRRIAPHVGNYAELARRFGITKQYARALVLNQKRVA